MGGGGDHDRTGTCYVGRSHDQTWPTQGSRLHDTLTDGFTDIGMGRNLQWSRGVQRL